MKSQRAVNKEYCDNLIDMVLKNTRLDREQVLVYRGKYAGGTGYFMEINSEFTANEIAAELTASQIPYHVEARGSKVLILTPLKKEEDS